jgi:hypothetical protein
MRSVAKQTILAAVLAWLAARVLRRVVGVALLAALIAGAADLAQLHGVPVRGAGRCEVSALVDVVGQLPDAISRGTSSTHPALPALRRLTRCHADRTSRRARRR